jgi:hypothetical protein
MIRHILYRITKSILLFCVLVFAHLLVKGQTLAGSVNITNGANTSVATGTFWNFYDSGGAGGNYSNNENRTHTFTSENGQPLVITFNVFNTRNANDYLDIYDGPSIAGGRYLGRWSGNFGGFTVRPDSASVTFRFISDGAQTREGWEAVITSMVIDMTPIETCSGTFVDNGGGGNYLNNSYYNVIYKSSDGQSLRFDFTSFNLRPNDILTVLDGDTLNAPVIGIYTANPGTILSSGETITFIFSSNADGLQQAGWSANISCFTVLTYYSYTNGDWNDFNTWTLDASGTIYNNPTSVYPTTLNKAVILNGRTITVTNNNNTVLQLDIQEGAILDVQGQSGQDYGTVMGKGRLRSTTGALPAGVFTLFTQAGGGTVELYGNITGSPNLSFDTFNNLDINGNSNQTVNIAGTTQINGNLLIRGGNLDITSGNGTTITVEGNINVSSGCNFRHGATNATNRTLFVKGDFENEGTVTFTNQTLPNGYTNNPTRSIDLTFNNAYSNQSFSCNGVTTLNKLIVDKGGDDTYMLDLNASTTSNFLLYGTNNTAVSGADDPGNVINNKALEVYAGTLRLGSNITIPRLLTAAGTSLYYAIDQDATIILDGASVDVTSQANFSCIVVYGKLKVMGSSTFTSTGQQGIILREYGVLEIEGSASAPTINTTAFRTSSRLELGTHRGTFMMSGGILNISGDNYADTHPAFALPFGDNTYIMTGGIINVNNSTYYDGGQASNWSWLVNANETNISVTGGTVTINASARNAYVNSAAPFYNLNITGTAAYTTELLAIAQQTDGGNTVVPATDIRELKVLNNLSIGANARFIANDEDITVGRNYTLNGTYTPGINTTIFNGFTLQSFTNAGTVTDGLYNMELKNASILSITNNLTVRSNILISSETTLRDVGNTIYVAGSISNSGTHQSATGGSIQLNGAGDQVLNGNGTGVFGNLTLNKATGTTTQTANQLVTGNLRLANTAAVLNIGSTRLSLSATSNIYDDLAPATTTGNFSVTRMIQTAGIQSDLGVERTYSATGTTRFPVGVSGKYTPARVEIDAAPSAWGTITINPVNSIHPLATATNILNYYWNVRREEMSGFTPGNIRMRFYYDQADVVGTEDLYIPGFYYPITWTFVNNTDKVTNSTNEILFDEIDQPRGHYTAGEFDSFGAVQTFFSRQSGNWSDLSGTDYTSWTNDPLGNAPATSLPAESSPVVIRIGHTITIPADENDKRVGSLEIQENAVLDVTTSTGHFFGLIYQSTISGRGTLRISSATPTAEFPGGDFGEFLGENGGTVEYYTTGTQDFTMPSGAKTTTTLLSEGFEGAFPPTGWSTASRPADEGGTQWERSNVESNNGTFSARHLPQSYFFGLLWYYQDDLLITPPLNLTESAAYELKFWRRNNNANRYTYQGIWISTTNSNPASFVEVQELGQGPEDTWVEHTVDLSDFAGNSTVYIAFLYQGGNTDDVYIDDVVITKTLGSSAYHHLTINPAASRTIIFPDINIEASGNLSIKGAGTTVTSSDAATTITVDGKTMIEETGTFRLDNTRTQVLVLNDTLSIASEASLVVNTAGATPQPHRLNLYGDVVNEGTLNLNPGSSKYADIYFMGTANRTFSGTGTTTLNRVYVDKGVSQTPVINVTADEFNLNTALGQALTISNGTIRFSGASLNLTLTTNSSFSIPATGCLSVNGSTVTVGSAANDNADILLVGKLEVQAGTMNVGAAANNNHNDIEYGTGGNPEVSVSGGTLNVNGQIRRSTTIATGNLTYRQSGGDVYIYGKNRDADQIKRALLEVLNSGSFIMSGGDLRLAQGVTSGNSTNTFGELYLNPAASSATGGTIHTGTSTTGATTNYFNLYLGCPVWSLTVNGETNAKTAVLKTFPATFKGSLVIDGPSESSFNTNSIDVTIAGDLISRSGSVSNGYIRGTNTQITTFNGLNQIVYNEVGNRFYFGEIEINLVSGGAITFENNNYWVYGNLYLNNGSLIQNNNSHLLIYKNLYINNSFSCTANGNGRLTFYNISQLQNIYSDGTGSLGRINIFYANGVVLNGSVRINNRLDFSSNTTTNSKLFIGDNRLTFGPSAIIGTGTNAPGTGRFIVTNGALSDLGVTKEYDATGSFTFPVGVGTDGGKYTPVTMNVTNTGGAAGTITLKPVDAKHPMCTNADGDELQYHWSVSSTGFGATPTVSHTYTYSELDVEGTEANYVDARLFDYTWYSNNGTINTTDNTISLSGVDYINGDYTAGDVNNFGIVRKYYSVGNGNWGNSGTWELDSPGSGITPANGPMGHPVFIMPGHTVTTNQDGAYAGSVDIASGATLSLGTKIGHNMGYITGAGTISISATGGGSFVFPGGDPSGFMNTTGSTVNFDGAGTIPSNIYTYQNILFTGNGDKTIPATDFTVLGNLTISNGNLRNNINNRNITIHGNWASTVNGGFIPGTGTVIFAGGNEQTITATGGENFYNFTLNKTAGTTVTLSSPVRINRTLILTSGIINTDAINLLTMEWSSSSALSGGNESAYVDGPLRKMVQNSGTFTFPVGNDGRYGPVYISGVTSSGNQYWTGQYFNTPPADQLNLTAPLQVISNNEYWEVTGVSGTTTNIRIRWDGDSQLIPTDALGRQKIRIAEYQPPWTIVGSTIVDGGQTSGTVGTSTPVSSSGSAKQFTLGLELTASGQITGTDGGMCNDGSTLPVTFVVAGTPPLQLTYLINGGNQVTLPNLDEGIHVVDFTYEELYMISGAGDYVITIDEVLDGNDLNGVILVGDATLTLYPTPNPVISGPTTVMISTTNNYSVANNPTNTYVWSVIGTTGGASATLTNETTSTVTAEWGDTPGTVTLQLVETTSGPNSCSTTIEYVVTVRDWPVIVGNFNVCAYSTEEYYSKAEVGHIYEWTITDGTILSGQGTYIIEVQWSGAAAGLIELRQGPSEPLTEISQSVVINPSPNVSLTAFGSSDICDGDAVTLLLGRSGAFGLNFTYYLELDETPYQTITLTSAADNPYPFTTENLVWTGPGINNVNSYRLRIVNESNGCSSIWDYQDITIWRIPETGPPFHIPNAFGE